jgi:hypothetical protein
MGLRAEHARPRTLRIADLVCVMIDLDTASAWCRGYCRCMQHCGYDSDIVKDDTRTCLRVTVRIH